MKDIVIRKALFKDKEKLKNLFTHYGNKELVNNRVVCYLTHNHTIIVEKDKEIVGKSQWYLKEDPNSGVVEIEEVYVFEKFRNKGIGTNLMKFTLEDINIYCQKYDIQLKRIYLFVDESNSSAIKLYKKFGFEEKSVISDFFTENEIISIYVKTPSDN